MPADGRGIVRPGSGESSGARGSPFPHRGGVSSQGDGVGRSGGLTRWSGEWMLARPGCSERDADMR